MTEPDMQSLLDAAARDEALSNAAARYCAEADTGRADVYERALQLVPLRGREWPFDGPRSSDFELMTEQGCAQYRADLAARRLAYLESRVEVIQERQSFRERLSAAASQGIERLAGPGRISLDSLIDTTLDTPGALDELHAEQFQRRQAHRANVIETHEAALEAERESRRNGDGQ
jgi:hypothetical protein